MYVSFFRGFLVIIKGNRVTSKIYTTAIGCYMQIKSEWYQLLIICLSGDLVLKSDHIWMYRQSFKFTKMETWEHYPKCADLGNFLNI